MIAGRFFHAARGLLGKIDTTPIWERRALTLEEIRELLRVAPEYQRLLYLRPCYPAYERERYNR